MGENVNDDLALLREYAAKNSEAAFAELVARHINLVHSVALRQAGDAHLAGDITQAVFIILARKANKMGGQVVLSGWLSRATRYACAEALRNQRRRRQREQEAYMQSTLNEPLQTAWEELKPALDDAMEKLGRKDHDALVLRFFEHKTFADVGAALGASEDAAKARVGRALEKLRRFFARRGVHSTTAIIAGALSSNSLQNAPSALAQSVTAAAMAKGAAASSSTLALVKGALKLMAWTKAKTVIVIGVVAALTAGTATVVVKNVVHANAWADDPKYWSLNNPPLRTYPPVLILRPTRFAGRGGLVGNENRFVGRDLPIQELVALAYDFFGQKSAQIIFPDDLPQFSPGSGYDLLLTLSNNPKKALQEAITKKFGLTGHTETIATNVLVERVTNPYPPGLKRSSSPRGQSSASGGDRSETIRNQPLTYFLSGTVENEVGKPVLDETGLKGRYDLQMQWNPQPGETEASAFERALREQLGIELVASNMPIEMLVVEKAE